MSISEKSKCYLYLQLNKNRDSHHVNIINLNQFYTLKESKMLIEKWLNSNLICGTNIWGRLNYGGGYWP
jgi:hypothetical protein